MAGKKRYRDFAVYPKYEQLYIHAFERMLQKRIKDGKAYKMPWHTGEDVFRWWMGEDFNQYRLEDVYNLEDE